MTLDELRLIQDLLNSVPGCFTEEQRAKCSVCADTKRGRELIEREIKLKEMDPRKGPLTNTLRGK